MASLSVKDRAKMFGNLASPNDAEKDRSHRRVGKISSPFHLAASPKATLTNAKSSPSPFPSSSQRASIPVPAASSMSSSASFSSPKEKKFVPTQSRTNSSEKINNMDWPDEDGIPPAPGASQTKIRKPEHNVAPVSLSSSKFSNNSSPFKILNNQGSVRNFKSNQSNPKMSDSSLLTIHVNKEGFKPQSNASDGVKEIEEKLETSNLADAETEKNTNAQTIDAFIESSDPSQDSSTSNHSENKLPSDGKKSTRAMRLMKARRASPAPLVSKNLKQSLDAAKVVMQEEKSEAGASDASSRSSLTNKELSDIAKRALLNVTSHGTQKGTISGDAASERLGLKAGRAVAMKNATNAKASETNPDGATPTGMELVKALSNHSNDSSRSRRMDHPAFAGRPKKTISSANIIALASYRNFSATRQSLPTKQSDSSAKNKISAENPTKSLEERFEQTLSDDDTSMASLEQEEMMHSVRDVPDESMHSMRSMSERQRERSMHSSNGRKRAEHFYHMGRIHLNTKNNCNDTVVSSLSGNTQSLQSTMSQSVASKTNKNSQKASFTLDPTPEYSSQTNRSDLVGMPTPSNRSVHSFANSIISASPKADYGSPSFRDHVSTSFMDTLEEKNSSSEESVGNSAAGNSAAGNSAELLDRALEAAIEDMDIVDSPKTNPTVSIEGDNTDCVSKDLSILPSSSSRRSPLGLVFKDTEESDFGVPSDPLEEGSTPTDTVGGEEDKNSTISNGETEQSDRSTDVQTEKQEIQEVIDSVAEEGVDQKNDLICQKQGSTSTKQTVSTSIRSGMSSIIQNYVDEEITKSDSAIEGVNRENYEGSTSIRTGLSGIQSQNDLENSISIHAKKNAIIQNNEANTKASSKEEENMKDEEPSYDNKTAMMNSYPDTIREENEVKSSQKSIVSQKDEKSSFSGLKVRSTATTDGSSGTTTGLSSSSSDQLLFVSSGNDSRIDSGTDAPSTNGNILPPVQTEEDTGEDNSNTSFSLLSSGSRGSRPWKNGFGKSIGNAIKTVLAKASPKSKNEESGSLFSDDDDDIFGGLEVEKEEKVVKPTTPKKQKLEEKTPKQKNFVLNEKKDGSLSRRTHKSLSRRTNESFSRRANGSLSRRKDVSNSRKSNEMKAIKKPNTPSQKHKRTGSSPSTKPASLNDRSGMIVDESEVVHKVNSDITSSLIGGPVSGPFPFQKAATEASKLLDFRDEKEEEEEPSKESQEPQYSKEEEGETFTLLMEESDILAEKKETESLTEEKTEPKEKETADTSAEDDEEEKQVESMFLKFGCGFVDPCSGFANLCTPANEVDDDAGEEMVVESDLGDKDSASVSSRSNLTDLEKKVWNEWDRLSESVTSPISKSTKEEKKDDYDKKREAARDKLLDIASTALSSQLSVKSGRSTLLEDDQCTKTTVSRGHTVSVSGSTESGFTKESESGASGNSSGNSLTSGDDTLGSSSQDDTRGTYSSASFSSGEGSDAISDDHSSSSNNKRLTPGGGPILLSFSQRSLMEKFSKQLTAVGVQVLKLNTRKQWQARYFTVSTELIALSAHEAISKTGEVAQCPKALLWLKKFNPKNGGYGIVNIDKNGHGGMLLVDLVDIQVSDRRDDMLGNPIPKKLLDNFEKSVLVTLKYKMKGILRSIEFRCRDNDEAQFLCTCMRVVRDLLRRERSLRQKLSKQASNKRNTPSQSRRR